MHEHELVGSQQALLERGAAVGTTSTALIDAGDGDASKARNPFAVVGPIRSAASGALQHQQEPEEEEEEEHQQERVLSPSSARIKLMQAQAAEMSFGDDLPPSTAAPHDDASSLSIGSSLIAAQQGQSYHHDSEAPSRKASRQASLTLAAAHVPAHDHAAPAAAAPPQQQQHGSAAKPPVNLIAQFRRQASGNSSNAPSAPAADADQAPPRPSDGAESSEQQRAQSEIQGELTAQPSSATGVAASSNHLTIAPPAEELQQRKAAQPELQVPVIRTPGSPSLIKRGANGVWRYRLPGEPEDGTPAPEDLLNAMAYSELRQPPQDQPPKDDLSGAEPPQQQQQPGGQDARGAEAPQWQLEAVPSEGLASVPSAAGREDSMLSVSQAMMQRSFNEDDPFQVLEESLTVLSEIEVLIRDSINLEPGAALGQQSEEALSRVPEPLLEALQETISVILDSRAEIESVMSASAASSAGGRSRRGGGGAGSVRSAGSGSQHAREDYSHLSPYLQPLYPGAPMSGQARRALHHHQQHFAASGLGAHSRPSSARSHASSAHQHRPSSAASSLAAAPHQPHRHRSHHSPQHHPQQRPQRPYSATSAAAAAHADGTGWGEYAQVGRPLHPSGATGAYEGGHQGAAPAGAAAIVDAAGGYLYQRMRAKRQEEEEEARRQKLEEYRRRRDTLHSPAPAAFLAAQAARQQEAERKKLSQMRSDLQYIDRLRERQARAELEHQQELQRAEEAVAALREHRSQAAMTAKWLQYQESLAANARLRVQGADG